MKKILYSLLFIFTVIFTACEEDLPKASFDLYELKSLTATAGDMNVTPVSYTHLRAHET